MSCHTRERTITFVELIVGVLRVLARLAVVFLTAVGRVGVGLSDVLLAATIRLGIQCRSVVPNRFIVIMEVAVTTGLIPLFLCGHSTTASQDCHHSKMWNSPC